MNFKRNGKIPVPNKEHDPSEIKMLFQREEVKDNSDNTELEAKIIYVFKIKGWSLGSTAAYFNHSKSAVLQIVKEFETRLGGKLECTYRNRRRIKSKITNEHILWISKYVAENKGKHFTINDIQIYLKKYQIDLGYISDWSIRKIMKTKIRYSLKIKFNPKEGIFWGLYLENFVSQH